MDSAEFSISHYPLMKDSGVDWIGAIPTGWGVKNQFLWFSPLVHLRNFP